MIFNTYFVYAPATKDDDTALKILKSFLCRALSIHISEKLGGVSNYNTNHEKTLSSIKNLDSITKKLVVKSRSYANIINNIN
jgi:hypothetical protein